MSPPDFTKEERYLIDHAKRGMKSATVMLWFYIIYGASVGIYAFESRSGTAITAAIIGMLASRVAEHMKNRRWFPVWVSVIRKFDAALSAQENSAISK